MPVAKGKPRPTPITMPVNNGDGRPHNAGPRTPRTPKTPQADAIAFFSGEYDGVPVQVWELQLEDDGAPGEGKSVSYTGIGTLSSGSVPLKLS